MLFVKDPSQLLLFGRESERLRYRKLTPEDYSTWLQFCEDPSSLRYFGLPEDATPQQNCDTWFERAFHRYNNHLGGMNVLVDKASGKFVGQCGLLVQTVDGTEELEIGYSLMPEFRGKGYASEASQFLKKYAFQHQLADSLISLIHVDNIPSQRVALANGMKLDKTTVFKNVPAHVFRIFAYEMP